MLELEDGLPLAKALDELWRNEVAPPDFARAIAERLSRAAIDLLVAWDAATVAGPRSGRLALNGTEFEVLDRDGYVVRRGSLTLSDSSEDEVLHVDGFGLSARIDGNQLPRAVHSATLLLRAVQTIRDHYDSIALRPRVLRDAALDSVSVSSGVTREQVDQWVRWMPALLEHLQD